MQRLTFFEEEMQMKDYFGYTGKVCVVTGAASGMGKATAEMLVDLGAMVYALDWAEVKVEGITAYLHTDLSKRNPSTRPSLRFPTTSTAISALLACLASARTS